MNILQLCIQGSKYFFGCRCYFGQILPKQPLLYIFPLTYVVSKGLFCKPSSGDWQSRLGITDLFYTWLKIGSNMSIINSWLISVDHVTYFLLIEMFKRHVSTRALFNCSMFVFFVGFRASDLHRPVAAPTLLSSCLFAGHQLDHPLLQSTIKSICEYCKGLVTNEDD